MITAVNHPFGLVIDINHLSPRLSFLALDIWGIVLPELAGECCLVNAWERNSTSAPNAKGCKKPQILLKSLGFELLLQEPQSTQTPTNAKHEAKK